MSVLRALICASVMALSIGFGSAAREQVFVNAALATGAGDGTSWANAFRGPLGLQQALQAIAPGVPAEVWVARGTYVPGVVQPQLVASRAATFQVASGVRVLGGFTGSETAADQRNVLQNICTLTGDQAGNGSPDHLSTENSAHVVTMMQVSGDTLIDGFAITGGTAQNYGLGNTVDREHGAGMLIVGGSPRVRSCRFVSNRASWLGAGLCVDGATDAVIENCTFSANTCRFYGAGAAVINSATARFAGCTFESNIGGSGIGLFNGRALTFNTGVCTTLVEDCVFRTNLGMISANSGGGIMDISGSITVRRCFFDRNLANGGGGVFFNGSSARVDACRFFANAAEGDLGDAVYSTGAATATLTNCAIWGHIRGPGSFADAAPVFAAQATLNLTNCTVVNNGSTTTSPSPIVATAGSTTLITLRNSIVWNNFSASQGFAAPAAAAFGGAVVRFERCNVQGWSGHYPGSSNSAADPRLAAMNGADGTVGTADDDFHLLASSPCIDAGDNSFLDPAISQDLDGRARRRDDPARADTGAGVAPIVDIGPFEFIPPCRADITRDGALSVGDIFELLTLYFAGCTGQVTAPCAGRSADFDGNAGLSVQDLFDFLSEYFSGCP